MPLVTARNLSIGFRGPALLDGVNFTVDPHQRIGLLGRNGAGKTTLMKMLAGDFGPDSGELQIHAGVHVAMLRQDVPQDIESTIFDLVKTGLNLNANLDLEPWKADNQVEQILSRMGLDGDGRFETLSSGMKRRVLLAKALVSKPDLLLLDEPTNHLDIESIRWLEDFLMKINSSFLFVTHDRMFLRRLANRILEIDRGRLFDWSCEYDVFLTRKQDALAAEEKQNALFDKRLAEEEAWIRKGIKARRTRNEGRVRDLKKMRNERSERRSVQGTSNLQIQEARKSGNLVIDAEAIGFSYPDGTEIFDGFTTGIMRGDKVGIIGRNGAGKTTLLKTLLGEYKPTSGKIKLGTNLEIAYFDQLREQLDPEATIEQNIGQGSDSVLINGVKKHVLGYLQDFLFSPERARTQIKFLSGGEKNRILLAKLFAKPANMIVLDEPTNDLDAETLELLEERLAQFTGTVMMVSHDREFLNNVVTSTIVFDENGVREYVGGYDDWQRQIAAGQSPKASSGMVAMEPGGKRKGKPKRTAKPKKMSYKEKLELESLPGKIKTLEATIESLHSEMAKPDFYQQAGDVIATKQEELAVVEKDLGDAYARWESLELKNEES